MPVKFTANDVYQKLKDKNITLIGEYLGSNTPATFRCEHNHEWTLARFKTILKGSGCPFCSGIILTKEIINHKLSNRRITLISDYTGTQQKAVFSCHEKHIWSAVSNSVLRGKGCPHCAGNFKLSLEVINSRLQSRGIKIIKEKPHRRAEFSCEKNHIWTTQIRHVLGGTGCPSCSSHGFNPSLLGNFYVLLFNDYVKYGITNNLEQRLSQHKRNNGEFTLCFNLISKNGYIIHEIEKTIKNIFGGSHVDNKKCVDGWTETIPVEDLRKLIPMLIVSHVILQSWEMTAERDPKTGQIVSKVGMPEFPGIDMVLDAAEKMYAFIKAGADDKK